MIAVPPLATARPITNLAQRDGLRRVAVIQGETRVSQDKEIVLTTVLGSCISACLYDPIAGVGGLNHFLLAEIGRAHV